MSKIEISMREMIAENFKVQGDKLEMMLEYAMHHASLEILNTPLMRAAQSILPSTLPMSLSVLNALDIDPKKVVIQDNPYGIMTLRIEFVIKPSDSWPNKTNEDHVMEHDRMFIAECASAINKAIAGCEEFIPYMLISHWSESFETQEESACRITNVKIDSRYRVKK